VSGKTGVGIVTYQREEFFKKLFNSIPQCDELVVVNDGKPYPPEVYSGREAKIIQHKKNKGVGKSKNDAMRYLLDKGCDHIFILEDDILIKDPDVFNRYISISKKTGIQHFNYAYHGPLNKMKMELQRCGVLHTITKSHSSV
jgi:glycosyltransferase involved in cell wall biosynthesis